MSGLTILGNLYVLTHLVLQMMLQGLNELLLSPFYSEVKLYF